MTWFSFDYMFPINSPNRVSVIASDFQIYQFNVLLTIILNTSLFVLIFARINFRASWIEYNFARINFRARPFYKKFFSL